MRDQVVIIIITARWPWTQLMLRKVTIRVRDLGLSLALGAIMHMAAMLYNSTLHVATHSIIISSYYFLYPQ